MLPRLGERQALETYSEESLHGVCDKVQSKRPLLDPQVDLGLHLQCHLRLDSWTLDYIGFGAKPTSDLQVGFLLPTLELALLSLEEGLQPCLKPLVVFLVRWIALRWCT